MIVRTAQARWTGALKGGEGAVRAGALESGYSFASRFEDGDGTTPEALIGAAHAGCFSMALSLILGEHGFTPDEVRTTATVRFDPVALEITGITLDTWAVVSDLADPAEFQRIADLAKENCPVSKALGAVDIQLASARLTDTSSA